MKINWRVPAVACAIGAIAALLISGGYDIGKRAADRWYAAHPQATCVTFIDSLGNESPCNFVPMWPPGAVGYIPYASGLRKGDRHSVYIPSGSPGCPKTKLPDAGCMRSEVIK